MMPSEACVVKLDWQNGTPHSVPITFTLHWAFRTSSHWDDVVQRSVPRAYDTFPRGAVTCSSRSIRASNSRSILVASLGSTNTQSYVPDAGPGLRPDGFLGRPRSVRGRSPRSSPEWLA